MPYSLGILVLISFFPFISHAAAGFAPGSLILSKESAAAGESISIHAAIFNSESKAVSGSIEFTVDGDPVGSQVFELDAGEALIVSQPWKAAAGEHQFGAYIDGSSEIKLTTSSTLKVTVADQPKSQVQEIANVITNSVTTLLGSSSPAVQNIASNIYATTESWREAGLAYLNENLKDATSSPALAGSATNTAPISGQILGTSTLRTESPTISIFDRAWGAILAFLLVIFGTAAFFYPFLALLFFILLYLAKKTLLRPHRS